MHSGDTWTIQYLCLTARPPGPPVLPEPPPPDRMIDSSSADEWRYRLCGACRCVSGCLSQTDGESEPDRDRDLQISPVRASFPRVHSFRLSTRRQEAKPLLSFPDWLIYPHLGLVKAASVWTSNLILSLFFLSILIIFSFSHLTVFLLKLKKKKKKNFGLWMISLIKGYAVM